jgi:CAAX prenyl protease-like protein
VPLREDGGLDPVLVALRLVGFVVVVPVMEELFWRSFLMRWIDRRDFLSVDPRLVSPLALVATSALFALEHSAWLAGLAAGLAYGVVYHRTGNLRTAIVSHAVSNLLLGAWILARQDWSLW